MSRLFTQIPSDKQPAPFQDLRAACAGVEPVYNTENDHDCFVTLFKLCRLEFDTSYPNHVLDARDWVQGKDGDVGKIKPRDDTVNDINYNLLKLLHFLMTDAEIEADHVHPRSQHPKLDAARTSKRAIWLNNRTKEVSKIFSWFIWPVVLRHVLVQASYSPKSAASTLMNNWEQARQRLKKAQSIPLDQLLKRSMALSFLTNEFDLIEFIVLYLSVMSKLIPQEDQWPEPDGFPGLEYFYLEQCSSFNKAFKHFGLIKI